MRELVVEKMRKNLYAADREAQSKYRRTANSKQLVLISERERVRWQRS